MFNKKFLEEKGFTGEVIHYIEYPFTKESLQKVLNKIDLQPSAIVRKNETQFEKHELGEFKFVPLLEDTN